MSSKKIKIEGICPYCGEKDCIRLTDYYYCNNKIPYAKNVPLCEKCSNDEIEIRKINNRRYKVVGKY